MWILRYSAPGSLFTQMVGAFILERSFRIYVAEISPSTRFCQALKVMACDIWLVGIAIPYHLTETVFAH